MSIVKIRKILMRTLNEAAGGSVPYQDILGVIKLSQTYMETLKLELDIVKNFGISPSEDLTGVLDQAGPLHLINGYIIGEKVKIVDDRICTITDVNNDELLLTVADSHGSKITINFEDVKMKV